MPFRRRDGCHRALTFTDRLVNNAALATARQEESDDRRDRDQWQGAPHRGRGALGPARRRHRQGHVGPRQDRRGRPLLREALHALAAPALVDRGLRLHRGRQAVGRPGHVHRGRAQVPRVRLLRVLPRRGAGDARAAALRDRRAHPRGEGLPHHADLRRGQAHRLLGRLLPRGLRHRGGEPRRDDRQAALRGEQGLGDALRRDPPRVRRGPAQGPERLPLPGPRRSPST